MSLKDTILGASDLTREPIEVPEWGCTVYVATMPGHDRNKWSSDAFDEAGTTERGKMRAGLLVHCLTDERGAKLFTPEDATALEGKNAAVLARLFAVAIRLNGLGTEAVDADAKN